MSPQLISMAISLIAVLIIAVHVLVGMVRGFKKSVFRLIWIAATGILCLIFCRFIANALVNFDISFMHLSVNGEKTFIGE